ncbi:MAG: DUF354 domain-containing protein [Blastocatellia bacterium]|nr:DUF354 domain-containing protein [Blastocatellia bacterium]
MPDKRAIWIDLDNSPHVPLFVPIIRQYRERGIEVVLTARDHSQTIELLDLAELQNTYAVIGRHHEAGKLAKVGGTLSRAIELASFIRRGSPRPAVAVSHGSRSMVLAAKLLRIPVVSMYDYEFTETKIFNRFSDVVIVPDAIPDEVLDEINLPKDKRRKYAGIKEELYVNSFVPTPNFRRDLLAEFGIGDAHDSIIAVLRPPATTANYHSDKSEVLLDDVLQFLTSAPNVISVIVSRTAGQRAELKERLANVPAARDRTILLEKSVKGLDLAFAADLLISGGGTMNREAALLGVPVYSIFAGRQGALDRSMEADGRIVFIRDARDLSKIRLERRGSATAASLTDRVERFVIDEIDSFL